MSQNSIPVSSADLVNYLIGQHVSAHYQIFCVVELEGKLDVNRLMRAVTIAYQVGPIVNCRLVLNGDVPYWQSRTNYDDLELCSISEVEDAEREMEAFMAVTLDPCQDPLVQVKLLRNKVRDILCVKISHACSDAAGAKEYISLLAEIYNNVGTNMDFVPQITTARRDLKQIFECLGITSQNDLPKNDFEPPKATRGFPQLSSECSTPKWTKRSLEKKAFTAIKKYATSNVATINDVLLTAFCRAYATAIRQIDEEYSIIVTVDLRRFVEKVSLISNFSGGCMLNVVYYVGETFEATLSRVSQGMTKIKSNFPGIGRAIEMEGYLNIPFSICREKFAKEMTESTASECHPPLFSNTGIFSSESIRFGDLFAANAYIVTPPLFAPGFLLAISTYNDILTISAGYYQPAVCRETVECFMENMVQELSIRACFKKHVTLI